MTPRRRPPAGAAVTTTRPRLSALALRVLRQVRCEAERAPHGLCAYRYVQRRLSTVDRLERLGLLEKQPVPTGGAGWRLTERGKAALRE